MSRLNKNFIVFLFMISSLGLQACKNENRSPVEPPPSSGQGGGGDEGSRSFSDQDGGVGTILSATFSEEQIISGSTADEATVLADLEETGLVFITDDDGEVKAVYTEEVEAEMSQQQILLSDIERLSLMIELLELLQSVEDVEADILNAASAVQTSIEIRLELLMSLLDESEEDEDTPVEAIVNDELLIRSSNGAGDPARVRESDIKLRQ